MVGVFRKTPRINQVEVGTLNTDGRMRPFVEYYYHEEDGQVGTVRFLSVKNEFFEGGSNISGASQWTIEASYYAA